METTPVSPEETPLETPKIPAEEALETHETPENDKRSSLNESEYDSAGSYSEEGEIHESIEAEGELDEEDPENSLERQEGDGQESTPHKKVDDDEDKKNPQYIPKRGTFYEHDDRTADDELAAEAESQEKQDKDGGKKKLWQDKKEKWSHDKFNDQDQAPKSKTELMQIYGYDIRNEDGPPKPRRRRRYGRGPNKYTRNWKDEDAYSKPAAPRPHLRKQSDSNEEFPPLETQNRKPREHAGSVGSRGESNNVGRSNRINNSARKSEEKEYFPNAKSAPAPSRQLDSAPSTSENHTAKIGSGRVSKQVFEPKNNSSIRDSDYKGFTKVSIGKNLRNTNSNLRPQHQQQHRKDSYYIHSQNFSSSKKHHNYNNSNDELENSMSSLTIESSRNKGSQRQSVPPRLQQNNEQKGSKRYSSIRQRQLPEANNSNVVPSHPNYYANDIQTQSQQAASAAPPPPSVIHLQTPGGVAQVPPVTAVPPILQAPPQQFAPAFPPQPPPTYLQAAVPPPTFIQQQAPPILNYVQPTPQFPPGGAFQGFQAPFNTVTQSTELYQPQGGITYYSTDQQITQRAVPQKRPKAAIPIVAPPNFDAKNMKSDEENHLEYSTETNTNASLG